METKTITLQDANNLIGALQNLQQKELDPKPSYWVGRLVDNIVSILKPYNESLKKLREKHGKVSKEHNNQKVVLPDSKEYDAFKKELDVLLDEEVEVMALEFSILEQEGLKIAPVDMKFLKQVFIYKEGDAISDPDKTPKKKEEKK